MANYSIKDVETLSGVKAHTLRIWEQRYDFLRPHRTDTNIRFYNDEQLKTILNIALLNRNGLKISKIASMPSDALNQEVLRLTSEKSEPNILLDSLIHSMLDFDESRFEKTLSQCILKIGLEATFSEVIFPMMERTGILWATGVVRPAQEHFISSLIRRKLCVAIDNQHATPREDAKRVVLFLPEGETHELMLLFSEYLLRKNGYKVAYLGNSLPFDDIEFINKYFYPDYFLTFITVPPSEMPLQKYIDKFSSAFPEAGILIGGGQIRQQTPKLPKNVFYVDSVDDLLDKIED